MYVGNDPVNLVDPSGEVVPLVIVTGAVVGGGASLAGYLLTADDASAPGALAALAGGAIAGAATPLLAAQIAGAGLGLTMAEATVLASGVAGAGGSLLTSAFDPGQKFFSDGTLTNAGISGGLGLVGGQLLKNFRLGTLGTRFSLYGNRAVDGITEFGIGVAAGAGANTCPR